MRHVQPFFVKHTTRYFKKIVPDSPYVHFYTFTVDTDNAGLSLAVPDGCADILFTLNKNVEGYLYGFVTKSSDVYFPKGSRCVGVRFRPGYLPKKLGVSIPEIVNTRIPMESLPGGVELTQKIACAHDFREQVDLLQDYSGDDWQSHDLLQQLIAIVDDSNGNIRVGEIEEQTLYTTRYINKVFNDNLGLSPKTYARHIRFQKLIVIMNNTPANADCPGLSKLAAEMGYYDQSHFNKEFRELASITPGEYFSAADIANYNQKFVYV